MLIERTEQFASTGHVVGIYPQPGIDVRPDQPRPDGPLMIRRVTCPDIAVVLTDLEGPARFRPRWPVIWAVPRSAPGTVAPFGQLLELAT